MLNPTQLKQHRPLIRYRNHALRYLRLSRFIARLPSVPPVEKPKEQSAQPERIWLPPSIFIPCALVNTVNSSHINTPVVGEVLRDVYQNKKLIIPAGTIVSCFASNAVRDRIEVAGTWLFVFSDGRQLKVDGIACARQANPENQQFGPEDASAGLLGEIVESDHWAMFKGTIGTLTTATMQAGTAYAGNAVSHGLSGVVLPDIQGVWGKYLSQMLNGETGDGRYVHVAAGTEFYIFPMETTFPTHRRIDNKASVSKTPPARFQPTQSFNKQPKQNAKSCAPANRNQMKIRHHITGISLLLLASCATTPETVTIEKKKGGTVVMHHKRRINNATVDRIEAVDAKGTYSQAVLKVYDVGRMPDGNGGMSEAHQVYKVVQSGHWNMNLPKKVTAGPRTVYTPPNYVPPPQDQRINDAVDEAKQAKKKLDDAASDIQKRLAEDNNLRGQLQEVQDQNQLLQDKLSAAMNTPSHKPIEQTEAEKAADPLAQWGKQQGQP